MHSYTCIHMSVLGGKGNYCSEFIHHFMRTLTGPTRRHTEASNFMVNCYRFCVVSMRVLSKKTGEKDRQECTRYRKNTTDGQHTPLLFLGCILPRRLDESLSLLAGEHNAPAELLSAPTRRHHRLPAAACGGGYCLRLHVCTRH